MVNVYRPASTGQRPVGRVGVLYFRVDPPALSYVDIGMDQCAPQGEGIISFGTDNGGGQDDNSVWGLDVDYSAFTGTIDLNVGILQFNDTLSMPDATLTVQAGSQITSVVIDNSATFSEISL